MTEAQLVQAIADVNREDCDLIDLGAATITLNADLLPVVDTSVTVSGLGTGTSVVDANGYSGFYFQNYGYGDTTATVSALAIENANRSGPGGAIYAVSEGYYASSLLDVMISDVAFDGNTATGNGGSVAVVAQWNSYLGSTDLTVSESTFSGSTSGGQGGALYVRTSYYDNPLIEILDSSFISNTASGRGGAIDANATTNFSGVSFTGNSSATGPGGALHTSYASTIADSSFVSNSATGDGGALKVRGDLTLSASSLSGNSAGNDGGALWAGFGTASITNVTVSANTTVNRGGGIYLRDGGSVNFSTVTANAADVAGGIYASDGAGRTDISNSIVFGNTATAEPVDVEKAVATSVYSSYSLFTSATSITPLGGSTAVIYGDPLLGALADNGGPTLSMLPGTGSPVIGAASTIEAPETDQRGFARVVDGKADMGAVQTTAVRPLPDLSQVPPSWHQATQRSGPDVPCPDGSNPSWAQWPNDNTGGWTCEQTTWWDVNKGTKGGWVTTPGFRSLSGGKARHTFRFHASR